MRKIDEIRTITRENQLTVEQALSSIERCAKSGESECLFRNINKDTTIKLMELGFKASIFVDVCGTSVIKVEW